MSLLQRHLLAPAGWTCDPALTSPSAKASVVTGMKISLGHK